MHGAWRHGAELEQLLNQIWESLTETPAPLAFSPGKLTVGPDRIVVQAQTRMEGDWAGDVTVSAARTTAESIARRMMAMHPEDALDPCDVDDAMGEIANIIGGNLKSLVEGVQRLSLPMVRRTHPDDLPSATAGEPLYESVAVWEEQQVLVQVHHTANGSSAA
jgi:chemotaxis protein CheX